MGRAPWHRYQVLTKPSERVLSLSGQLAWAPQIWMGVSIENEKYAHRIDDLRKTAAHVKFLSLEPLLGPLPELNLRGIDWAIVGGESGPGARPIDPAWVTDIRNQCLKAGVPFFFKQWGGVRKKQTGRSLERRTWDEMPIHAEMVVL
jgi:protein gp37